MKTQFEAKLETLSDEELQKIRDVLESLNVSKACDAAYFKAANALGRFLNNVYGNQPFEGLNTREMEMMAVRVLDSK